MFRIVRKSAFFAVLSLIAGAGDKTASNGEYVMKITVKRTTDSLYIYLGGELDEYNAPAVRERVDKELDAHSNAERVIIDLSEVRFLDSTAIGFLIGRYKKLKRYSTPLFVQGATPAADKVLSVSGIYTLIPKI